MDAGTATTAQSRWRPRDAAPTLPGPYLLFLGDTTEPGFAKTAFGLSDWAGDKCVGEYCLPEATVSTGLKAMTPAEAYAAGARSMIIGVANPGGIVPASWLPAMVDALNAGLDLISGMHSPLASNLKMRHLADSLGRSLIDVRCPPANIPVGTGRKRTGKRLLTVGTDCALGKKYTALALARAFAERGLDCDFRATGQTGIMIAGSGIPIDAVVADFLAGAAEMLSPDADEDHWDVIEGQGSLFHPAYAGVSTGLLHGSQPDVIILCHQAGRQNILGLDQYALPSVEEAIELNLKLARRINPAVRCGGVSINTSHLAEPEADRLLDRESARLNLPAADPMRGGSRFAALVESCLAG
ncbi:DUF1611 domain-containing protein [Parasphingorhabdus sp.]|uniref:DUF1611 domain-containing protein n=1 Tax=Parasphingorhabdus sp. TaxID=2709688 RepID=UPI00300369BF